MAAPSNVDCATAATTIRRHMGVDCVLVLVVTREHDYLRVISGSSRDNLEAVNDEQLRAALEIIAAGRMTLFVMPHAAATEATDVTERTEGRRDAV